MACVAGVRDVETGKAGSRYLKQEAGGAVGNDGVGQSGNSNLAKRGSAAAVLARPLGKVQWKTSCECS